MKTDSLRKRLALLLISPILLLISTGATFRFSQASIDTNGWSNLVTGIDYQLFHLTNPRQINLHVARMDRSESSAIIDTAIAQGSLAEGWETISDMAARNDQAINYWGESWGNRNRVVVAINGYFFNLSSGTPLSGQIHSGWYAQRFNDYVGDAGFAWNVDRSASIGKCVFHTPRNQFITVLRSGEIKKIGGVNVAQGADEMILYTPQYASSTGTDSSGVEILVEMSRPSLVLPEPAMAIGTVTQIRDLRGNTPIPFDHVVLSATGEVRTDLLSKLQEGDEIGISQEISNCSGSPSVNWTKTYASMGGDYHFLTGGAITIDPEVNPDAMVPNSRTAVAFNSSYVYFVVVDGWNLGVSEGIKIHELGSFAIDMLGATDAVTLDSGGSSTMVINGLVVNNTYCNFTRNCGMQLTEEEERSSSFGRSAASGKERGGNLSTSQATGEAALELEPLVGNAMMMVSVELKARSDIFSPGVEVVTSRATDLRLGPGTNYAVLGNIAMGTEGIVLDMHYNELGGVLAKGVYWERVEMGSLRGWVRQDDLGWIPIPWPPGWFLPVIGR
jgi:hypothetical protein